MLTVLAVPPLNVNMFVPSVVPLLSLITKLSLLVAPVVGIFIVTALDPSYVPVVAPVNVIEYGLGSFVGIDGSKSATASSKSLICEDV